MGLKDVQKFCETKATEAPNLVAHAIYKGLADRIQRGDFGAVEGSQQEGGDC